VLYVERGGKALQVLVDPEDARVRPAFEALAAWVTGDRRRKLGLERVDGQPVVGSDVEDLLVELGFRQGPKKLTLSA
jgi:ATP-dependent helicase Lhr and Lhr-like helicase